jgi:hypothetical protein
VAAAAASADPAHHVKRRISSLVAGAVLMLVAVGCGTEILPAFLVRYYQGVPPGVTPAFRDDAVWMTGGRMAVVTYGSSSCPALPIRLDVSANNNLKVTVNPLSSGPCTADLAPTTSVIEIPKALDITRGVTVTITGDGYGATVTLPPRPSDGH